MFYYLDTEFIEDFTAPCLHLPSFRWEKAKHYIELISIGIVSEDGREYYAVSKDFDLKHVWNKYDLQLPDEMGNAPKKIYWLRENVLKSIWEDLKKRVEGGQKNLTSVWEEFTYKNLKTLIQWYGKTNDQIATDITIFTAGARMSNQFMVMPTEDYKKVTQINKENPPTFYAYYADYDWVVFCSLFGRMLDLPEGYPMFCMDLKQDMEVIGFTKKWKEEFVPGDNEHHALADARWNKKLHDTMKAHAEDIHNGKRLRNYLKLD